MLYFCDKIRVGTWESAPALVVWVLLLNIFVKRCTSSDVENKRLSKAGANAHSGARKFYVAGARNDERLGAGGVRPEFGGEIETRDPRAVILAFYPGRHVRSSAEGIAKYR